MFDVEKRASPRFTHRPLSENVGAIVYSNPKINNLSVKAQRLERIVQHVYRSVCAECGGEHFDGSIRLSVYTKTNTHSIHDPVIHLDHILGLEFMYLGGAEGTPYQDIRPFSFQVIRPDDIQPVMQAMVGVVRMCLPTLKAIACTQLRLFSIDDDDDGRELVHRSLAPVEQAGEILHHQCERTGLIADRRTFISPRDYRALYQRLKGALS